MVHTRSGAAQSRTPTPHSPPDEPTGAHTRSRTRQQPPPQREQQGQGSPSQQQRWRQQREQQQQRQEHLKDLADTEQEQEQKRQEQQRQEQQRQEQQRQRRRHDQQQHGQREQAQQEQRRAPWPPPPPQQRRQQRRSSLLPRQQQQQQQQQRQQQPQQEQQQSLQSPHRRQQPPGQRQHERPLRQAQPPCLTLTEQAFQTAMRKRLISAAGNAKLKTPASLLGAGTGDAVTLRNAPADGNCFWHCALAATLGAPPLADGAAVDSATFPAFVHNLAEQGASAVIAACGIVGCASWADFVRMAEAVPDGQSLPFSEEARDRLAARSGARCHGPATEALADLRTELFPSQQITAVALWPYLARILRRHVVVVGAAPTSTAQKPRFQVHYAEEVLVGTSATPGNRAPAIHFGGADAPPKPLYVLFGRFGHMLEFMPPEYSAEFAAAAKTSQPCARNHYALIESGPLTTEPAWEHWRGSLTLKAPTRPRNPKLPPQPDATVAPWTRAATRQRTAAIAVPVRNRFAILDTDDEAALEIDAADAYDDDAHLLRTAPTASEQEPLVTSGAEQPSSETPAATSAATGRKARNCTGGRRVQRPTAPPIPDPVRVSWDLDTASVAGPLDKLVAHKECLTEAILTTVQNVPKHLRGRHEVALTHGLRLGNSALALAQVAHANPMAAPPTASQDPSQPSRSLTQLLNRATVLMHITSALLLAPGGGISQGDRYSLFFAGTLEPLVQDLLDRASQKRPAPKGDRPLFSPAKVCKLARTRGGLQQAAKVMTAEERCPGTVETLEALREKHPHEDKRDIAAALAATRAARTTAQAGGDHNAVEEAADKAFGEELQRVPAAEATENDPRRHSLPEFQQMPDVDDLYTPESLRAALSRAKPHSAPGTDGLRYLHLQQLQGDGILAELATLFATTFQQPHLLPPLFWDLHTAARLIPLGTPAKVRPIAVGGVLRRLFGSAYVHANSPYIGNLFADVGQHGVCVPGGCETVATAVRLLHEGDAFVLSADGSNAFNAVRRAAFLPATAALLPTAFDYIAAVYGGEPSKLLFRLDTGDVQVVESQRGCQQGDAFGGVLFCLSIYQLMKGIGHKFRDAGITIMAIMDDLYLAARMRSLVLSRPLVQAFLMLRDGLQELGITTNLTKSKVLPPRSLLVREGEGALAADRVEEAWQDSRPRLDELNIPVVTTGLQVVGAPIGTDAYVKDAVRDALLSPACCRLLEALPSLPEAQVAYALLRYCGAPRATFLARATAPQLGLQAFRQFDAALAWAFAGICGLARQPWAAFVAAPADSEAACGLPADSLLQLQLPSSHGGLGIGSAAHVSPAAFAANVLAGVPRAVRVLTPLVQESLLSDDSLALLPLIVHLQGALEQVGTGASAEEKREMAAILSTELVAWSCGEEFLADIQPETPGEALPAPSDAAAARPSAQPEVMQEVPQPLAQRAQAPAVTAPGRLPAAETPQRPLTRAGPEGAEAVEVPQDLVSLTALLTNSQALRRSSVKLQRRLTKVRNGVRRRTFMAKVQPTSDFDKDRALASARALSSQASGAHLWTLEVGGSPHTTIPSPEHRLCLLRQVGLQDAQPTAQLCPARGCGKHATAVHMRTCMKRGTATHRHNFLAKTLELIIRKSQLGGTISREDGSPFARVLDPAAPTGAAADQSLVPARIADIAVHLPGTMDSGCAALTDKHLLIDVTMMEPSATPGAALAQGVAAQQAQEKKIAHHCHRGLFDQNSYAFVPFAVETYGCMGSAAVELLEALATHASGGPQGDKAQRASLLRLFRRMISVSVARAVSRQALTFFAGPLELALAVTTRRAAGLGIRDMRPSDSSADRVRLHRARARSLEVPVVEERVSSYGGEEYYDAVDSLPPLAMEDSEVAAAPFGDFAA